LGVGGGGERFKREARGRRGRRWQGGAKAREQAAAARSHDEAGAEAHREDRIAWYRKLCAGEAGHVPL
jgi:hypothetical protein